MRAIVVVEVREARPVVSPAYDDGTVGEAEIIKTFRERFARVHRDATPPARAAPARAPVPTVESAFREGDRIRFPDPLRNEQMTPGTFVGIAVGEPIEVPSRVGGVPPRLVESAWVRREDGTTARVIHGWIRPMDDG